MLLTQFSQAYLLTNSLQLCSWYYEQMELSLLILVCIHKLYTVCLEIYLVPIGHGLSFFWSWKSHGKWMLKKRGHPGKGSSKPPPHQLGVWGSAVISQWGLGRNPDRPKVFHYFQHSGWPLLTLILLTVDDHAAIGGGARPPWPLARTPLKWLVAVAA